MKKLFLLLALALCSLPAWACGPYAPDYGAYIFRLCPNPYSYSRNNDQRLADAWSSLIGSKVSVAQSIQLSQVSLAQLDTLNNPVARYARRNKEVADYLRLLVSYLETTRLVGSSWDYPSAETIDQYQRELKSYLVKARRYQGQLMRERYYLLRLRIMFRLEDYNGIISLWETDPLPGKGVFVDMSRDLYAGALFHTGRNDDAAVQYALSGNIYDAHYCMRNLHGVSAMTRVAKADINSPVLPYMLEEVMNGCRESFDFYSKVQALTPLYRSGNWFPYDDVLRLDIPWFCLDFDACQEETFYRISHLPTIEEWFQSTRAFKIHEQEIAQLEKLIDSQLDNYRLMDPAMWLSARAYLYYLRGNYQDAWATIQIASRSHGSEYSHLNVQFLTMLISTRLPETKVMESTVAQLIGPFLSSNTVDPFTYHSADGSYTYYSFNQPGIVSNYDCLLYLVRNGLVHHYLQHDDSVKACLAWSLLYDRLMEDDVYYYHLPSSGGEHYDFFQSMSLPLQQQLLHRIDHASSEASPLLRLILDRLPFARFDYLDVIGTCLIRDGRFSEAIPFLQQVPLQFLSRQPIAPYAANRSYHDVPWERNPVDEYADYSHLQLRTNAKLDYCREVIKWRDQLAFSSGEDRLQAAYRLAELYHQASANGSCWWLAYYGVSNDPALNSHLHLGHFDFQEHSRTLLMQALDSRSTALRYKAYFLLLSQGHDDLLLHQYDYNRNLWVFSVNLQSPYYPVLMRFKHDLYGHPGEPNYVSSCDDLVQLYKLAR